jgi:hypothetical protein
MRIRLVKQGSRHRMICIRPDGSSTQTEVGGGLPHHDLAHFVVEKTLGIQSGFYGNIKRGYSIQQLSDKNVIIALPPEAMFAELLTRTLQAVDSGSCAPQDFIDLVRMEAGPAARLPELTQSVVSALMAEFQAVLRKWNATPETGSLELEY